MKHTQTHAPSSNQKRPDVHKIVLSIKLRFPPLKKCQLWGFSNDLYSFSSFWALSAYRGGGKTKLCRQEFYGHPDFSDWSPLACEQAVGDVCGHPRGLSNNSTYSGPTARPAYRARAPYGVSLLAIPTFTPLIQGVGAQNTTKQGVSDTPPPKFRGWIFTPWILGVWPYLGNPYLRMLRFTRIFRGFGSNNHFPCVAGKEPRRTPPY